MIESRTRLLQKNVHLFSIPLTCPLTINKGQFKIILNAYELAFATLFETTNVFENYQLKNMFGKLILMEKNKLETDLLHSSSWAEPQSFPRTHPVQGYAPPFHSS